MDRHVLDTIFLSNTFFFFFVEQQDVHNFLLQNMTNGGILDLMLRYLKAVGQKFMEEWPPGMTAVVLEVYQAWRKHSCGLPNPLFRDCSKQHIRVNDKSINENNYISCSAYSYFAELPIVVLCFCPVFFFPFISPLFEECFPLLLICDGNALREANFDPRHCRSSLV